MATWNVLARRAVVRWLLPCATFFALACGDDTATTGGGQKGTASATSTSSNTGVGSSGVGGSGAFIPAEGAACAASPPPTATPQPTPLDQAGVAEALGAITGFLDTRAIAADAESDARHILDFVAAAPHVLDAGVGPDCAVWARLVDGTPVTVVRRPEVALAERRRAAPNVVPTLETKGGQAQLTYALPASGKAFIVQSEGLSASSIPTVETALKDRGYAVVRRDDVTLADLRQVKDAGVLWFSGHGATCGNKARPGVFFCLSTSDLVDPATGACQATDCAAAEDDRLAGRIGFMIDPKKGKARVSYGATPDFVSSYWSFAAQSLVVIDTCNSMAKTIFDATLFPNIDYAEPMRAALRAKGAGTLLGWDSYVSAGFAANSLGYLFDRMLGANVIEPVMPPPRPFSFPEVYAAMLLKNKVVDPTPQTTGVAVQAGLRFEQLTTDATILAPSIRNMVIGDPDADPGRSELAADTPLTIYGEMGTKNVSVTIAQAAVSSTNPRSDKVVARLPLPSTKGEVEVSVTIGSEHIKSNKVPLTSWKGPCKFTATLDGLFGAPGVETELDCQSLHLRADIHRFRMRPDEEARAGRTVGNGEFEPLVHFRSTVSDTVCIGNASGSGTNAGITTAVDPTQTFPITWKPMHDADPMSPNPWYAISGIVDTADPNAIRLSFIETHKVYPNATITVAPSPGMNQEDFPISPSPVDYEMVEVPLDVTYSFHLMPLAFDSVLGNHGELECHLTPEGMTAPTSMTGG